MLKKLLILLLIAVSVNLTLKSNACAIPALQLYVEGASYDPIDESWELFSNNFVLWVMGDVGAYGNIDDVQLAVAFDSSEIGTISIVPTTATAGQLPSLGDPSTPASLVLSGSGADDAPLMNNGSPLPSHGVYGPGVNWQTYAMGNFTLTDSPIGDYMGVVPSAYPDLGQINAYEVTISGYSDVYFDAFDHYVAGHKAKYTKAPFSHDAVGHTPEPASFSLLGLGLLGLLRLRKKQISS